MPALAATTIDITAIERSNVAVVRDLASNENAARYAATLTTASPAPAVLVRRAPAANLGMNLTPKPTGM